MSHTPLRNWIKSFNDKLLGNKSKRSHRPLKNKTFRLSVENLEERAVPAALMQTTTQAVIFTSYFESAVYKVDAQTGALLQTLVQPYSEPSLQGISGVTVGPDGNLFMSSQLTDSIVEYNFADQSVSTFVQPNVMTPIGNVSTPSGTQPFAPAGLTFGPDGNLYVSLNGGPNATSGGEVVRFNINYTNGQPTFDNNAPVDTVIATGLVEPTEMTFGVNPGDTHNLYVSNSGSAYESIPGTGGVVKITNADGAFSSSTFIAPGSGSLDYPTSLNWGANGKLYVTDAGATSPTAQGQVLIYNADGSFDAVLTSSPSLQGQFPSDAAFLANGNLLTANLGPTFPTSYYPYLPPSEQYLAEGTSGSIGEFNPDGSFNQSLTASAFPGTVVSPYLPEVTNISPSQLVVDTLSPVGATIQLSPSTVNVAYAQSIMASGANLTVSNIENAIPGLTVPNFANSVLNIGGTPTAAGTETFTVTATFPDNSAVTTTYTVTINPAITLSAVSDDTVGVVYDQNITAAGGTGKLNLDVSNIQNAIPGLSVQTSGTGSLNISGTPTAPGAETFTVTATDAVGATTSQNYTIIVNAVPSITAVVINQDLSALYNATGQPSAGVQRSMVNDVVYTFNGPVNITSPGVEPNVFTIAVASGWTGSVPTLSWAPVAGSGNTEWAVTFSGNGVTGGSIADGAYTITVNDASAIADAATGTQQLSLAPSGIGSASQNFFRLYGDINGDEAVNNADNIRFKQALTTYSAAFDFNNDGAVNNADNIRFKQSLSIAFTGFSTTI